MILGIEILRPASSIAPGTVLPAGPPGLMGPKGDDGPPGPQGGPGVSDLASEDTPGLISSAFWAKLRDLLTGSEYGELLAARLPTSFTDGIAGSFAVPYIKRARQVLYLDEGDNVTGNGTSDDTVGVQAIVDKAVATGRPLLMPYDATFRLTAPLTISAKPLVMQGQGVDPGNLAGTAGRGSWLLFDHNGRGMSFSNTGYGGRNSIKGVGTKRSHPTPVNPSWEPGDQDYDFSFDGCEIDIDVMLWNAARGVQVLNNVGMRTQMRLRGQPLKVGVQIDRANDVSDIDVHFWPFWRNDEIVHRYTAKYTNTFEFRRVDGVFSSKIFAIFHNTVLHYSLGTYGASAEHTFKDVYADLSRHLLRVETGAVNTNVVVLDATHHQDDFGGTVDGEYGIEVSSNDVSLRFNKLKINNVRGGYGYIAGSGTTLDVDDFSEGTAHKAGLLTSGFVGIMGAEVTVAAYHRANVVRTQYGQGVISGSGWTSPNNGRPRAAGNVKAVLDRGRSGGVTNSSGDVTVAHNGGQLPDFVVIKPLPPMCSYRLIATSSTAFTVRALDSNGAPLAGGEAVTFSYEVGVDGPSLPTTSA